MIRALAFALAVFAAGGAIADYSPQQYAGAYDYARPACRQAELDGSPISEPASERYCVMLEALGRELKQKGWCWDAAEVEWSPCKQAQAYE